jgi:thiamine-monophosphate kinase
MPDIRKLGEQGVIDLFKSHLDNKRIVKAIGDDCAAIEISDNTLLLWTTDMLIEGVHFERHFGTPFQLGCKSLSVNLSDIAAMGGEPLACLINLSIPADLSQQWLSEFRDGFIQTSQKYDCPVIGGDSCGSRKTISISVTVLGEAPEGRILQRDGAKDGDDIWLSAIPGVSALGLGILTNQSDMTSEEARSAIEKHLNPQPCLALGRTLASKKLATACIDTSDGLVIDLGHICEASRLGAVLVERDVPLPSIPADRSDDPLHLALHGGEDYSLLFTAPATNRKELRKLGGLYLIGRIDDSVEGLILKRHGGKKESLFPQGFSHF